MNESNISVVCDVVGTGGDGSDASLILTIQRHSTYSNDIHIVSRFMFNAGEGTQRLCAESKLKMSSIQKLFLTRMDPQTCAGIPGLIMALSSSGAPSLEIVGPVGIKEFLLGTSEFVRRKYPVVEAFETDENTESTTFQNDNVHIDILQISRSPLETKLFETKCISCKNNTLLENTKITKIIKTDDDDQSKKTLEERNRDGKRDRNHDTDDDTDDDKEEYTTSKDRENEMDFRCWLIDFYERHEPSKVVHVDQILRRYKGMEMDLQMKLRMKYGEKMVDQTSCNNTKENSSLTHQQEETVDDNWIQNQVCENEDVSNKSSVCTISPKESGETHSENSLVENIDQDEAYEIDSWLKEFYRVYEPSKLQHIGIILRKFSGRDEDLKRMLQEKYSVSKEDMSIKSLKMQPSQQSRVSRLPKKRLKESLVSFLDEEPSSVKEVEMIYVENEFSTRSSLEGTTLELKDKSTVNCYVVRSKCSSTNARIVIVDCPSESWIANITSHPHLQPCHHHPLNIFFHITKAHLLHHPKYRKWMESFPKLTTRHIVMDGRLLYQLSNSTSFSLHSSFQFLLSLNAIDSLLFPVPYPIRRAHLREKKCQKPTKKGVLLKQTSSFVECYVAVFGLRTVLSTPKNFSLDIDFSSVSPTLDPVNIQSTIRKRWNEFNDIQLPLLGHPFEGSFYPELVFLGTGSAAPSKYRNSSGIYLQLSRNFNGWLMDVGEGCYGQLHRRFGEMTSRVIGSLIGIWISHKHADHHCGLMRIVIEYAEYNLEKKTNQVPLLVIAPTSVIIYLQHFIRSCYHSSGLEMVRLVHNREFENPQHPCKQWLCSLPFFQEIKSIPVVHCYDSYGLVLILRNGMKIVYSGDTRPCQQLVREGRQAYVLIHEATFADDRKQDALLKKHSTISEALFCGKNMEAQHIILTHFSQRYPSIPDLQNIQVNHVTVAFDSMSMVLREDVLQRAETLTRSIRGFF